MYISRKIFLFISVLIVTLVIPGFAQQGTMWTNQNFNNNPANFQFAIISDINGGERAGVIDSAIEKLNLLQPEFVMCVGDLIPGYTNNEKQCLSEYDVIDAKLKNLQMPFHYVPGNHDITNETQLRLYKERYGSTDSSFVYKDVLFLVLSSIGDGISDEQVDHVQKALADNPKVRWTNIFFHDPLWNKETAPWLKGNWLKVEDMLKGRPYTVFTGHIHQYTKYIRNGQAYYTLATTGGISKLRGSAFGEFDHIMWITMSDKGPVIANLMLDGIQNDNIRDEATADTVKRLFNGNIISYSPIYIHNGKLINSDVIMLFTNNLDNPLRINGKFSKLPGLSVMPTKIDLTIPPNSSKIAKIKIEKTGKIKRQDASFIFTYETPVKLPNGQIVNLGKIKQKISVINQLDCKKAAMPVTIDGELNEWNKLPFNLDKPGEVQGEPVNTWTGVKDAGASFDVSYDDNYLYIGIKVTDDKLILKQNQPPWVQDGVEVRLDGRPDPKRSLCCGEVETKDFLLIPLSPGDAADKTIFIYKDIVPEGLNAVCIKTPEGYNAEIAVPISYLNDQQNGNWNSFRLNVAIDDRDIENDWSFISWRPDWRQPANYPGSGTFVRK